MGGGMSPRRVVMGASFEVQLLLFLGSIFRTVFFFDFENMFMASELEKYSYAQ
jgi:hypothetical protein